MIFRMMRNLSRNSVKSFASCESPCESLDAKVTDFRIDLHIFTCASKFRMRNFHAKVPCESHDFRIESFAWQFRMRNFHAKLPCASHRKPKPTCMTFACESHDFRMRKSHMRLSHVKLSHKFRMRKCMRKSERGMRKSQTFAWTFA